MFKRLLFSLWSSDEICHYIKDLHSTVIPSTPSSTQSSSWRPWWRWAQCPWCSCSRRSVQCSRRPGVCCQEWSEMFSTLELAERSCHQAVVKPLLSLAASCRCCSSSLFSREKPSKGSRTGASFNSFPFLIPPSLFQDVEIHDQHRAMPSDECM